MKKICSQCGEERDVERDFSLQKAKGAYGSLCKPCRAELARISRANDENKRKLYAYLSSHPCVDCGKTDIRILEFDHVRGNKTTTISNLIQKAASWSTIEAEIVKCEVRCVNCHRIKTSERGKWWRSGRS
jgi:hypothetical protein